MSKQEKGFQPINKQRGYVAAFLGAMLPLVFPLFGSAPLLALRRMGGRSSFLMLGLVSTTLMLMLSLLGMSGAWLPFVAVFLLVWFYTEFESMDYDPMVAGSLAIGGTAGVSFLAFSAWLKVNNLNFMTWAADFGAKTFEQIKIFSPETTMTAETVLQVAPSTVIILAALSLWFGLIFESRFRLWLGQRIVVRQSLCQFRVPEWFIFLGIAAAAAAFVKHDSELLTVIGLNVFNVIVLGYFFQGLAVVASYFAATRMGLIWQFVLYFILIVHMFLVVAAIGVADYWLDLRTRMQKKTSSSLGQRGKL